MFNAFHIYDLCLHNQASNNLTCQDIQNTTIFDKEMVACRRALELALLVETMWCCLPCLVWIQVHALQRSQNKLRFPVQAEFESRCRLHEEQLSMLQGSCHVKLQSLKAANEKRLAGERLKQVHLIILLFKPPVIGRGQIAQEGG